MPLRPPAGFIRPGFDPLKNPDAPTIGTATGGNAQLSVTFTAPSNVGGSAITGYAVAARKTSDGTSVGASGASSPIIVTGLTNDAAYTATVAAVNSYGPSASSAASNSVTPEALPTIIGQAYGGGYYAGQIGVSGIATHYIIIGPKASADNASIQYKNFNTEAAGADSVINGPQNTADLVAGGSSTVYPAAHFCNNLIVGGYSDWYMPAKNEFEVCYFNLKPSTTSNITSSGINANAVPARASNYTAGTPAQTSATIFQSGGTEAFANADYWTSTESSTAQAFAQYTGYGLQFSLTKYNYRRTRAVRRIPV